MPIFRDNRALLDAFRRGEPAALTQVYYRYHKQVEALMRRGAFVGKGVRLFGAARTDVADLVQEAFTRAFSEKARIAYNGLDDYQPYLMGVCRFVLSEWARKRGRELPTEDVEPVGEPQEDESDMQQVRHTEGYVKGLSGELQQVYSCRYEKAMSQDDVATALGMSRQRVRTLEQHLRQGLRKWLAKFNQK